MKKKYISPHNEQENKIFSNLEELMPFICERLNAGQTVRFSPRGVSMLPMIRQGIDSVAIALPPKKLKKYDIPLYRRSDGSFVLHRVVKVGETYTCIGDNQFTYENGINHDQIIAVVTAFFRKGKEHSVTEIGYKAYCVIWHISRPLRLIWRKIKRRLGRLKCKTKTKRGTEV
jgi:hypothetical protein